MKTTIATDSLQSQRLLRCGVSADTADMCWIAPDRLVTGGIGFPTLMCAEYFKHDDSIQQTPAWSLSALLGLLPKTISDFWMTKWYDPTADGFVICDKETPYLLSGDFQLLHIGGGKYQVEYDWDGFQGRLPQSDNPIEACVLAIELLTSNGYKLNEI